MSGESKRLIASAWLRRLIRARFGLTLLILAPPTSAWAWLAPGHMAAAAITYDDLQVRDPVAVQTVVALLQSHPDRARFDRRLQGLKDAAYDRRLFELMARWPDDARGTPFDHPIWHYSEQVQSGLRYVLPFGFGLAPYAFHHELAVARDPDAPAADRAVALCWVMHIVQDIHEPMHTGMWMGPRFPLTDRGGTIAWVRTSSTMRPETLHWLWDSAGAADPDEGRHRDPDAFAAQLEANQTPDAAPSDTTLAAPDRALARWIGESRRLARHVAYEDGDLRPGTTPQSALLLQPSYVAEVQAVTQAQLVLAGHRTAQLLIGLR